jgi:hypothetical protein
VRADAGLGEDVAQVVLDRARLRNNRAPISGLKPTAALPHDLGPPGGQLLIRGGGALAAVSPVARRSCLARPANPSAPMRLNMS